MKLQKAKKTFFSNFLKKALAISWLIFAIFASNSFAQSLPNCANLPSSQSPQAGVNCLYYGLPLCSSVAYPNHRVNCADLSDLPLCSDIIVTQGASPINPEPGKNCVELCSSSAYENPSPSDSPALLRGTDYAVFNKDCTRFCDDVEDGIVAQSGVNCKARSCHQLESGVAPSPKNNCELLSCNLLTPDELNKIKFEDDSRQYCSGDTKCYNFTQAQLPYMKIRTKNPTCQIHDCKPRAESCGADDTVNITNQGADYTTTYEKFVTGGYPISSSAVCNDVECRLPIKIQYRCTNAIGKVTGGQADIFRNASCDTSGEGAKCSNNYCYETLDCNDQINKILRPECQIGQVQTQSDSLVDPFNSWFYRPKPLDKALDPEKNGMLREMRITNQEMCYTKEQMRDNGWGEELSFLGWFHSGWIDDTLSPGSCESGTTGHHGHRGQGYVYLCGTKMLLYNNPSDYASYYKGYVRTVFTGTGARHTITICNRYKNTVNFNACGKRECGVDAAFSQIDHVTCGHDVCKDYVIDESDPKKCMMDGDHFDNDKESDCSKTTDFLVRNRAVKYGNKICGFLDVNGRLAYSQDFLNGTETLDDGVTCISDKENDFAPCLGYNTNNEEGFAHRWRTLMKIPYIQNNRSIFEKKRGYLDHNGKLYPEQECPKITLRVPPPDLYNLANSRNSEKLFMPPLYIRSATVIKGGIDSSPIDGQDYGVTDFHYPEIRVQYGTASTRMSLSLNQEDGQDQSITNDPSSPSSATMSVTLYNKTHSAELFVKKEYDTTTHLPTFCLYRKIKDINGLYIDPYRVACVNRKLPEIDNAQERNALSIDPRIAMTYLDPSSQFNNAKISLRYAVGFGENGSYDKCENDDLCSNSVSIENQNISFPTCSKDLENYQICAKREECTQLYVECAQNEINYNYAVNNSKSTSVFEGIRKRCNENLIPFCNEKKGLENTQAAIADIYNPVAKVAVDPKIYGWFNEICIVKGFEEKLTNVVSYLLENEAMGKCLINPLSPYLIDLDPATNCDNGGFAPNCLCIEAPEGYTTTQGQTIRQKTPREAGLCVDLPLPKICPIIDYNTITNPDINDPEYIQHSLGKTGYNNATQVHESHKYRTFGKEAPDEIINAGHAEFSAAFAGMKEINGLCKGFWTYQKNDSGIALSPKMDCVIDSATNEATWSYSTIKNPCIRYSCPAISTFGPSEFGDYQGDYDIGETGEEKGRANAFAIWPKYTKTNDFVENVTAASCIPGFKAKDSSPVTDSQGKITDYENGALPQRSCNQLGKWQEPQSYCQRIKCNAVNPTTPKDSKDINAWAQWFDSGGATFPEINASRSIARIQNESIAIGSCNNSLGFYQTPGGNPPTRECDYLGNWLPVKDPCVSTCDAIEEDSVAKTQNNGFAKWKEATGAMSASGVEGEFNGCASNYIKYPYPPATDLSGNILSDANDLSRAAQDPKRLCKTGVTSLGAQVSVWSNVINACINQCPGSSYDDRIGVGRTKHLTTNGEIVLNWPSGKLGSYQYVTNWTGEESHLTASYFFQGRTNKYYLMRRYCNANGKWSEPQATCSGNDGLLGKARYNESKNPPGYQNSVAINTNEELAGSCIQNHWASNRGQDPLPKRQCLNDPSGAIDKTYLEFSSNTKDCEPTQCSSRPRQNTAKAYIPQVSGNYQQGQQIKGGCQSGYTALSNSATIGTVTPPTIHCQQDGTWSPMQNENSCKKSCYFGGLGNPTNRYQVNRTGCGNGTFYVIHPFTMAHGQLMYFGLSDECGGDCDVVTHGFYCNNGTLHRSTSTTSTDDRCYTSNYKYQSNSFSGTTPTPFPWWSYSSAIFPMGDGFYDGSGSKKYVQWEKYEEQYDD